MIMTSSELPELGPEPLESGLLDWGRCDPSMAVIRMIQVVGRGSGMVVTESNGRSARARHVRKGRNEKSTANCWTGQVSRGMNREQEGRAEGRAEVDVRVRKG